MIAPTGQTMRRVAPARAVLVIVLAATTGCFLEVRGGGLAPTRDGYGSVGGEVVATSGGEGKTSFGRAGGGVSAYGYIAADGENDVFDWVGGAVHGRAEVHLKHLWRPYQPGNAMTYSKTIVSLTTLAVGVGRIGGQDPQATLFVDAFTGIGVSNRSAGRARWFTWAIGAVANRLWPETTDGAWFVGIALAGSVGYDLGKPPPL